MIIGVDIGGTTTKFGLFNIDGQLLGKWNIVTDKDNFGCKIIPNAVDSIKKYVDENNINLSEIKAVGLGVPCPINIEGIIEFSANLGWKSKKCVTKEFFEGLNIPVFAGNDANVATLGEAWMGVAKNYNDVVMVTLGTGVGGGIISGGHLLFGKHGMAGEIGHIHVEDMEKDTCGCGKCGCLEQMSSATGIVRLAKKELKNNSEDSILRDNVITAKEVFAAYKLKDIVALKVVDKFAKYLARALVNISVITDPKIFVIGGGVSLAGEVLIDIVKKYYLDFMPFGVGKDVIFKLAKLGSDAGIYGAAKLAIDNLG